MKQDLLLSEFKAQSEFGGTLAAGKRKTARPITTKKFMHLVLRSEFSTGKVSLLKHERMVRALLSEMGRRFYVQVSDVAVNSNHLHLLVMAKSREGFKKFLRSISGILGKRMLKYNPLVGTRFWTEITYSRIVEWGYPLQIVRNYIEQNVLEANGFLPYRVRKQRSKRKVSKIIKDYS